LYVKGKLEDPQKVLVDVGAGYFIEMSADRAVDHYTRKVDHIRGEVDSLRSIVQQKAAMRDMIVQALQKKIQTLAAAQQPTTS
ncbi:UNVERIFIED_CONTAM: Prefoldin subunit 5, partial [Eudyptes robustus]